jgi:hypothetical protein
MKFNKLYNLIEGIFEPASPDEIQARQEIAKKELRSQLVKTLIIYGDDIESDIYNVVDMANTMQPLVQPYDINIEGNDVEIYLRKNKGDMEDTVDDLVRALENYFKHNGMEVLNATFHDFTINLTVDGLAEVVEMFEEED